MPIRSIIMRALLALSIVTAGVTATACHPSSMSAPQGGMSQSVSSVADDSADSSTAVDPTCPTVNQTSFAKTKFVLHAGLGFGAFHRWIYKPARSQAFASKTSGRTMAFVKAGAAALFVIHETRLAIADAKASPALCKATIGPLTAIGSKIKAAVAKLKNGDSSGLNDMQTDVQQAESAASSQGDGITEDENANIYSR